ncbi:MAG: cobalamin B12-binding domain-containing protein [Aestuariivita sp.]|nr:cobalamin B12-binding domain-containing protein [Aestuariivita sp.]MCY4203243.1 cobalamin B12-binding domain-containing protein [Aestuariivita sp.]
MNDTTIKQTPQSSQELLTPLRSVLSQPSLELLAKSVLDRLETPAQEDWRASNSELDYLCQVLCAKHSYRANKFIHELLQVGLPLDRIYRKYLAEAARRLGTDWENDTRSFEQVSLASARIYKIMDSLRKRQPVPVQSCQPRLAFAAVPGEQHTLGVEMATDLFRREGWDVAHLVGPSHEEILLTLEDKSIFLLGLSASGSRHQAALIRLILALRMIRPEVRVIVSGAITQTENSLALNVGIDAVVRDVPQALEVVRDLASQGERRP